MWRKSFEDIILRMRTLFGRHSGLLAYLSIVAMLSAGCVGDEDPKENLSLVDTRWSLLSFEIPDSIVIEITPDKTFSVQFFDDFHLSGINDCNEYFGVYRIWDNGSLTIDSLGTSLANCGESMDKEYYRALHFVKSYEIIDNVLRLYYDDNNSILEYLGTKQ